MAADMATAVSLPTTELVDAARAGDTAALALLLQQNYSRLRRVCSRLCGAGEDSEEVLQDTLIQIVRRIDQFRGDAAFMTWASAIARSQAHRQRRKRSRYRTHETAIRAASDVRRDFLCSADEDPELDVSSRELRDAMDRALSTLAPLDREVFWLRQVDGMTAPEVADALGLTVPAVKSRLHRARRALRDGLESLRPVYPGLDAEALCAL